MAKAANAPKTAPTDETQPPAGETNTSTDEKSAPESGTPPSETETEAPQDATDPIVAETESVVDAVVSEAKTVELGLIARVQAAGRVLANVDAAAHAEASGIEAKLGALRNHLLRVDLAVFGEHAEALGALLRQL
jgi:hypothetical protein